MQLKTHFKSYLADTVTPVGVYLRLRDIYPNSILLESNDYHGNENSYSYICCKPMAGIRFYRGTLSTYAASAPRVEKKIKGEELQQSVQDFIASFQKTEHPVPGVIANGLFGYTSYNASYYFHPQQERQEIPVSSIPELMYDAYQYIIAINHYSNKLYIFNNVGQEISEEVALQEIDALRYTLNNKDYPSFHFKATESKAKAQNEDEFDALFKTLQHEIYEQDIHSVITARKYIRPFTGDDFNVYRAVRSTNPSPYLYFFDYGSFKLIGSAAETQLVVKNSEASITLLEGSLERLGNDEQEFDQAKALARKLESNVGNQLMIYALKDELKPFCQETAFARKHSVETYAHVYQVVSEVRGKLTAPEKLTALFTGSFPSPRHAGYPRRQALRLIHTHETVSRNYFGGSIGFIGFDGSLNHALMNKAFLSRDNILEYYFEAVIEKQTPLAAVKKQLEENQHHPESVIRLAEEI